MSTPIPSRPLTFLLRYYRPYAGRVLAAVGFMLPSTAISLAFPRLTGTIIDGIITSNSVDRVISTGGLFLGLLITQAIVGYIVSVTLARTTERVMGHIRTDLFRAIITQPLSTVLARRVGELSSRISSDMTQVQETFSFSLLQLLRQSILLVGSIILIITTSLELTLPILMGIPIIVGAAVFLGRAIRALSVKTQDALARSATIVDEVLQSIASVKSFVQEEQEIRRYTLAINENVALAVRGARLRAAFVTFIIFVIFGGIAAVILYGAGLVASGSITMGQLLSFLMYAMFVAGALGSFAELFGSLQKSLGATTRFHEIMLQSPEDLGADTGMRAHSVELRNVAFAYPERPTVNVVHDLNLAITAGERIAFVGMSGAGKSTTAALIQRLYEPTEGTIRYDGLPTSALTLRDIRSSIGVVPQDIVLIGGTIEDNIRYGNNSATMEMIVESARRAQATEFIDRFPDGLATIVGERGVKLSGGQRQRIAIARALLKNPPILILDEATSSLDAESEHLIKAALEELMAQRTTIIIAHRLSTVRECDRIAVFNAGTIENIGAHDELLQTSQRYRHWCDLQFLATSAD